MKFFLCEHALNQSRMFCILARIDLHAVILLNSTFHVGL